MKAELETERKNTAATIEKMNADFAKRTEDIQASLSERQGAPDLISPVPSPTTRSPIKLSSVSPDLCETIEVYP